MSDFWTATVTFTGQRPTPPDRYRLTGLSDGDYRAELTKEGFSENNGDPFSHVAGFVPVRVDAQLKPWAALGGRVVDEDLKPVAGVRVEKRP